MNAAAADISEATRPEAPSRPSTVVVGFDGSATAVRGLTRAASLIADDGLLVVVVVEAEAHSPGILSAPLLDTHDGHTAKVLAEARQHVPPRAARLTVIRRGDPAEVLTNVAREHEADLLVVGRRGRDFAARVLLGSVASRLVADAPCDVLVVR
jgi:nucleotide-binding universal stress UspA family protein